MAGPAELGGAGTWIRTGAVHGALAGAVYGLLAEEVAAVLALLLFTPLLCGVLLGRFGGVRRSALGGLALALSAIFVYLLTGAQKTGPFLDVTQGGALEIAAWILAWAVFGSLIRVFAGSADLGPVVRYQRVIPLAQGGTAAGALTGAVLAGLSRMDPPGEIAGGIAGALAGLALGIAARNDRWSVLFAVLGAGLGAVGGSADLDRVYLVLGAGVAGGLYWTVAGALVGLFGGASIGARAGSRVVGGPLHSRLFAAIPVPQGPGMNLGLGLLIGLGGLFMGASVGMVAGSVLGGLAGLPREAFDGVLPWALGGAAVGILFAAVFISRVETRPDVIESRHAALGLWPWLAGLGAAGIGGALAVLGWAVGATPGGFLYWLLAGAGVGGLIGAKVWAIAEK
jgi:hypothetical protein